MRCWRVLLCGLVLVLVGCGVPGTTTPDMSTQPSLSAEERQQLTVLQDQLRQARKNIEAEYQSNPSLTQGCFKPPFPVLAPTDVAGYTINPLEVFDLQSYGSSVRVRLVDRSDSGRWVEFWQGMGCNGALAGHPEGATDIVEQHPIDVPGLDSRKSAPQLQGWKEADGSTTRLLIWYSDSYTSPNTQYQLTGHNVSEATIIRLAASMRPVK